jgi:glycosyltransferase involved in cell wall biosynthesis
MLAFEFPPLGTVGVQRSVKLAKYLPEHGVQPVVITSDAASQAAWFGPRRDDSLSGEVAADLTVHRIPCPRPDEGAGLARRLRAFCSVGEGIGASWEPQLLHRWDEMVQAARPAALYVSVPPFSIAPAALRLARRSRLPLILDFRDHWSQWGHNARPTRVHHEVTLRRERSCILGAHAIAGVTGQLVRDLQHAHPRADPARFHAIPNGYDGELVSRTADAAGTASAGTEFVIGYAGSFYYSPEMRAAVMDPWYRKHPRHWLQYAPRQEDWLYRSPFYFFAAVARLFEMRPELRRRLRVCFAGDRPEWLQAQVEQFGLQDIVKHLGRLSHHACIEFEASCDALLVTAAKVVGGRDYCIAGKTFEYLTTGRPILGIVTPGEQQDFLAVSGAAVIADADDPAEGARAIARLIDGPPVPAANRAALRPFHRREIAGRMAALVHSARPPR